MGRATLSVSTAAAAAAAAAALAVVAMASAAAAAPNPTAASSLMDYIESQARAAAARMAAPTPNYGGHPSKTSVVDPKTGKLLWDAQGSGAWTSGFWPGLLWQVANHSKDDALASTAAKYTQPEISNENRTDTHDVGFMVFDSFGKGLELGSGFSGVSVAAYTDVVKQTAHSLSQRWSPVVGMLRSWGSNDDQKQFEVIIDNLMNLEILWYAATLPGGNATWADLATRHALKTAEYWIRPPGSTWHLVVFNPTNGSVISRSSTPQGLSTDSCWARGQAWGIYGFTMAYRYTRDARFLEFAKNVTQYWLSAVPSDGVPLWDFDAKPPQDYRDTSAAAITASALLELAAYTDDQSYAAASLHILESLGTAPYLSDPTKSESALSNCAHDCNNNPACAIIESDYYAYEALRRHAGEWP